MKLSRLFTILLIGVFLISFAAADYKFENTTGGELMHLYSNNGNLSVLGNISAPYFVGSGKYLTDIDTSSLNLSGINYWSKTGNDVYYNSGNVGIGTSSTKNILDIVSSQKTDIIRISAGSDALVDSAGIGFSTRATFADRLMKSSIFHLQTQDGGWGIGDLIFAVDSNADNQDVSISDEKMRITSNGNVGIGTTSPNVALDVNGSIKSFTSSNGRSITLDSANGAIDALSATLQLNRFNSNNVAIASGGGNVGIGTATPSQKLDVNGSAIIRGNLDLNNNKITNLANGTAAQDAATYGQIQALSGNLSGSFVPYNGATQNVNLGNNDLSVGGSDLFVDNNNGRVGIGTTTPTARLQVSGGTNYQQFAFENVAGDQTQRLGFTGRTYLESDADMFMMGSYNPSVKNDLFFGGGADGFNAASSIRFYTEENYNTGKGTEKMRIDPTGNVGIGTTTPQNKLNVIGDTNVTGTIYQNGKSLDNTYIKNDGDNATGEYNFDGGWQSGGASIIGGNLYAQALYAYDINSLQVSNLDINGSMVPATGFDNQFDIGNSTNRWRDGYFGGDLTVDGTINANVTGAVNPGFTTGSVIFQDANGLAEDNSNLFWDDSSKRLGVGTNSPTSKLYVKDGVSQSVLTLDGNGGGKIDFLHNGGSRASIDYYNPSGQMTIDNRYQGLIIKTGSGGTSSESMRITSTGNVGIGDTSPDGTLKLDVEGQVGATQYCDEAGNNCKAITDIAAGTDYVLKTGDSMTGELKIDVGGGTNNGLYINGDMRFGPDYAGARTGLFKYNTAIDGLIIDTWGSGKEVRIGGSKVILGVGEGGQLGNVGVGTTSPSYKLQVQDGALFVNRSVTGEPTSENGFRLKWEDVGGVNNDGGLGIDSGGNPWINYDPSKKFRFIAGTAGDRMIIDNSGYIGANYELGVRGTINKGHSGAVPTNLAAGISLTGSGSGAVATDGLKTVGSTYQSFGGGSSLDSGAESGYLQIDLGQTRTVSQHKIYFYNQDDRRYWFKLKYSYNNVDWFYAVGNPGEWAMSAPSLPGSTATGNIGYVTDVRVDSINARYWRIYGGGSTANTGNHIYEWEIFEAANPVSLDVDEDVTANSINSASYCDNNGNNCFDYTNLSASDGYIGDAQAHTAGGSLNMNNNLITNIGNAGTDFTSGGGLIISSDDTNAALKIMRSSNTDQYLSLIGGQGSGYAHIRSQYHLDLKSGQAGSTNYDLTLSTAAGEALRVDASNSNNIGTSGGLTVAGTFDPNGAVTLPTTGISGAGTGSGLDADLLDGISSGSFLRSDTADTATGQITLNQAGTTSTHLSIDGETNYWKYLRLQTGGSTKWDIATKEDDLSGSLQFRPAGGSTGSVSISTAGTVTAPAFIGDGSGLTGIVGSSNGVVGTTVVNSGSFTNSFVQDIFGTTSQGFYLRELRTQGTAPSSLLGNFASGLAWKGADTYGSLMVNYNTAKIRISGGNGVNPVWTADLWTNLNDGSGSGLDADLLDGKNLATTSATNTVAQRDGSGDINVRLIRSEYDSTNSNIGYIMTQVDTASNNYVRPSTPAQLKTALGLSAGGSGDIWVEKAGDTMTGTLNMNTNDITKVKTLEFYDSVYGSGGDTTKIFRADPSNDNTNLRVQLGDETGGTFRVGYNWYSDGLWYDAFSVTGSGNGVFNGGLTSTTLNTGQGANELYAMNQNVRTTDIPNFNGVKITAGYGNGIKFWASDTYKISMGNAAENHYGPVTDYSINNAMSNTVGRGFTWGVTGSTPAAALEVTTGDFATKGTVQADTLKANAATDLTIDGTTGTGNVIIIIG